MELPVILLVGALKSAQLTLVAGGCSNGYALAGSVYESPVGSCEATSGFGVSQLQHMFLF